MRYPVVLTLVLLSAGPLFLWGADDHIVEERTRTYMGRTTPAVRSEIWIGDEGHSIRTQAFLYLSRYDLGKKYIVNLRNKKYLEAGLDAPPPETSEREEPFRIQTFGMERYVPHFDWIVRKTGERKMIDGKECMLFVLDGDADYAEEIREMWVTSDVDVDARRFFERVTKPELDEQWLKIYADNPMLQETLVMEAVFKSEHSIAPLMVWNIKLVTVETAAPPEGIYEVPEDFTKVATREDLYSRKGE